MLQEAEANEAALMKEPGEVQDAERRDRAKTAAWNSLEAHIIN